MKCMELYNLSIKHVDETIKKLMPYQVMEETSDSFGGMYSDEIGFCSLSSSETMKLCWYLGCGYCSKESEFFAKDEILKRISLCIKFVERFTRPSGLIDLRDRNYDSSPDTAFAMNRAALLIYMARHIEGVYKAKELEDILSGFVKRSALAIKKDMGFHTPNHRWIISGTLAVAQELYPELDLTDSINMFLNETIDLNSDGLYSEKSFLYSAHINDKLMHIYHTYNNEDILDDIQKNCHAILKLMNSDGALLTTISIRQDNGKRVLPTEFLSCFLITGIIKKDNVILSGLEKIVKMAGVKNPELIYVFARYPQWKNKEFDIEPFDGNETVFMKESGIWGYKKDYLSLWAVRDKEKAISVAYGDVILSDVSIHCGYYAGARFIAKNFATHKNGLEIDFIPTYMEEQAYHMPGYWKPLGRPVTFDELPYHIIDQRERSPRPDLSFKWKINVVDDEIKININSCGGLEKVPYSIEFSFEIPGEVYTEDMYMTANGEQSMFLSHGSCTYRHGIYAITVDSGECLHKFTTGNEKNKFKVFITSRLPTDKVITIKCHTLAGERCRSYYVSK